MFKFYSVIFSSDNGPWIVFRDKPGDGIGSIFRCCWLDQCWLSEGLNDPPHVVTRNELVYTVVDK